MIDQHFTDHVRALFQPLRELSAQRELLMLLLIAAETMIVYIFAGTLLAERVPPYMPLPVLLIFATLLIARLVPHILETIRVWTPEYEIVMTLAVSLNLLTLIKLGAFPHHPLLSTTWLRNAVDALILQPNDSARSVWMLILFTTFAWWRGKTRAEATLETSYTMLRFGLAWLAGGMLITIGLASPDAAIFSAVNLTIVGFLVFTLLAITVARQPEDSTAITWSTSWIWLVIFSVPILIIIATTVTTVGILTRDTLDLFLSILSPVFWAIRVTLQAVVLSLAVLAFLLVSPLIWFLERQGFHPLDNFPNINLSLTRQHDADSFASQTLQIENPVRYLIAGLFLLVIFWFLVRFAFRRRKFWQEQPGQQRESLIDWDDAPTTLLARVRNWVTRRFRPSRAYALPAGTEWVATRRIRQLYQRFLRFNRQRDLERAPDETPTDYAQRLASRDRNLTDEIEGITRRYNQARYSGKPAETEHADQTETAYTSFVNRVRNDE